MQSPIDARQNAAVQPDVGVHGRARGIGDAPQAAFGIAMLPAAAAPHAASQAVVLHFREAALRVVDRGHLPQHIVGVSCGVRALLPQHAAAAGIVFVAHGRPIGNGLREHASGGIHRAKRRAGRRDLGGELRALVAILAKIRIGPRAGPPRQAALAIALEGFHRAVAPSPRQNAAQRVVIHFHREVAFAVAAPGLKTDLCGRAGLLPCAQCGLHPQAALRGTHGGQHGAAGRANRAGAVLAPRVYQRVTGARDFHARQEAVGSARQTQRG